MTPLIGFSPDIDPVTPGVITYCENLIPTLRGMKAAPSMVALPTAPNPLPAECIGGVVARKLDDTRRIISGTQTKLYELLSGTWTDVSRAGNYTGTTDSRWRFAQYGDQTIATNGSQKIQASSSGAFADIADAPTALCICTASDQVIAGNTGTSADQWAVSDIGNSSIWTPSAGNNAANGRLLSSPGPIVAMVTLGRDAVAYKARSMYHGRRVDGVIKWAWDLLTFSDGALSQECVIDVDGAHLFLGQNNFYMYDGSRPQAIGMPCREWFMANSDPALRYKTVGYFDRTTRLAKWYFFGVGSAVRNKCLVYHVDKGTWGKTDYSIESVLNFISPALTIDQLTNPIDTYALPFDSPFYTAGAQIETIFDTTHTLKSMSGPAGNSVLKTGIFGDDSNYTRLYRVRPHFITRPTSATLDHLYSDQSAGNYAIASTSTYLDDSGFDVLWEARYHQGVMSCTGDMEVTAVTPYINNTTT